MLPVDDAICGLIEFYPAEARLMLRASEGSDHTVHNTLLSLAQDLLESTPAEYDGWVSETVVAANTEALAAELALIYRRLAARCRTS